MKKKILAAILSFGFFSTSVHSATFENKPIKYSFSTENSGKFEMEFPFVILENKIASDRINLFLHQAILHTLPPEKYSGERIDFGFSDYSDLSLAGIQLMREGRVLSVTVTVEGCGAYCESSDSQFEFDTRTGRVLTINEIIKKDSISKIAKTVAKANSKKIKNFLVQLEKNKEKINKQKNIKDKHTVDGRDLEEVEGQIAMYEQCLENYNPEKEFSFYGKYSDPGQMTIGDLGISFSQGKCSNHAMRALDDLWELVHTIKNEDMRPYLTDYGKYIVLGEGSGEVPAINPYSQLYRGKIGNKIDIIMHLGNLNKKDGDGDYSALNDYKYFYTKYRKPIELELLKKSENGEFVLTEHRSEADGSTFAKFTFKIKNGKLVGQWSSKDKTYPFEAVPY
jgi:hypothetical protein